MAEEEAKQEKRGEDTDRVSVLQVLASVVDEKWHKESAHSTESQGETVSQGSHHSRIDLR